MPPILQVLAVVLAGWIMAKLRFTDALGELKVPVINLDPDQVAEDLRGLGPHRDR